MGYRLAETGPQLTFQVVGAFGPEDASDIEELAQCFSPKSVRIDLHAAGEKSVVAMWILAELSKRDPARVRLEGLTLSDARLLQDLGSAHDGTSLG